MAREKMRLNSLVSSAYGKMKIWVNHWHYVNKWTIEICSSSCDLILWLSVSTIPRNLDQILHASYLVTCSSNHSLFKRLRFIFISYCGCVYSLDSIMLMNGICASFPLKKYITADWFSLRIPTRTLFNYQVYFCIPKVEPILWFKMTSTSFHH